MLALGGHQRKRLKWWKIECAKIKLLKMVEKQREISPVLRIFCGLHSCGLYFALTFAFAINFEVAHNIRQHAKFSSKYICICAPYMRAVGGKNICGTVRLQSSKI
jgi:hypothetical protein